MHKSSYHHPSVNLQGVYSFANRSACSTNDKASGLIGGFLALLETRGSGD